VNQEESEHNEVDGMKKGVDSKGEVMHIHSSVTCAVRRTRTTYGDRCFAVAGPRVCNSLPTKLRQSDSLGQFKRR